MSVFWNYFNSVKEKMFYRDWAVSEWAKFYIGKECVYHLLLCSYKWISFAYWIRLNILNIEFCWCNQIRQIDVWSIWSTSVVLTNSLNLISSLLTNETFTEYQNLQLFGVSVLTQYNSITYLWISHCICVRILVYLFRIGLHLKTSRWNNSITKTGKF